MYSKYGYGLLGFESIWKRIPPTSQTIYIMTERSFELCHQILAKLYEATAKRFPNAAVALLHGGDIIVDMIRLANANVTICSASTFCFYPALASHGVVHFPVSTLIAHPSSKEATNFASINRPQSLAAAIPSNAFGDNFQFIWDATLFQNIGSYFNPHKLVIYALLGETIPKEDTEGQVIKPPKDRSVYYVYRGIRHGFNGGAQFEALGFHWEDIWNIDESLVTQLPQGESIPISFTNITAAKAYFDSKSSV